MDAVASPICDRTLTFRRNEKLYVEKKMPLQSSHIPSHPHSCFLSSFAVRENRVVGVSSVACWFLTVSLKNWKSSWLITFLGLARLWLTPISSMGKAKLTLNSLGFILFLHFLVRPRTFSTSIVLLLTNLLLRSSSFRIILLTFCKDSIDLPLANAKLKD